MFFLFPESASSRGFLYGEGQSCNIMGFVLNPPWLACRSQLLAQVRMGHALNLLQQGLTPLEVALACGYDSPSRFAARFKQEFGLTPHQYLHTCPARLASNAK